MKNINDTDKLKFELPDYISGGLKDNSLREKIESMIESDLMFRNEYERLRSAVMFLKEAEFKSPDEVYFANLQSNILKKTSAKESVPFYSKIVSYWKYLVPAVTVCIVILVYTSGMNNNSDKISSLALPEKKVPTLETPETIQTNDTAVEIYSAEREGLADLYYSPDDDETAAITTQVTRSGNNTKVAAPGNTNNSSSIEELKQMQIDLFNGGIEDSYEEDFRSLTPEQQKVILDELRNSNI
ncbi:hypothetical protein BH10BAC5_BH10BAC5_03970 [soil metagenome]